ncbi:MAG: hypothetical protein ACR2IJ_02490 [Fluviibacter sp.]
MPELDPLVAPIITDYRDKGVKKAQKSFLDLEGSAKKLGKALGIALSARAVVNFGKASVKAFLDDERAAKSLATQLGALGMAIDTIGAESFIQNIQRTTGVLDDELRPAYSRLAAVTLSASKTQDLLNLAMDISAGTGASLQATTDALAKAYQGNTRSLGGLGVALSKAELQTSTFAEIQTRLADIYKGQAAAAADTYAGKVKRLSAAFSDLKENIGSGIITGFANLTSAGGEIDGAISGIQRFGIIASEEIAGLGIGLRQLMADLEKAPIFGLLIQALKRFGEGLDILTGASKAFQQDLQNYQNRIWAENTHKLEQYYKDLKAQNALRLQQEKAAKAAIDAQNKAKRDQAALDKAALALRKAESIFDLEAIQIAAAMKNPALTLGEYARLQLKKDILALEQAIQDKDVEGATILAKKVNIDIQRLNELRNTQLELIKINDLTDQLPENLELIDLMNLANALALIKKLQTDLDLLTKTETKTPASTFNPIIGAAGGIGISTISPTISSNQNVQDTFEKVFTDMAAAGNNQTQSAILALSSARYEALASSYAGYNTNLTGSSMSQAVAPEQLVSYNPLTGLTVNVNVQGSVSTEQDLVNAVLNGIQQQSANGTKSTVNRLDALTP